jgi:hypothetical protein
VGRHVDGSAFAQLSARIPAPRQSIRGGTVGRRAANVYISAFFDHSFRHRPFAGSWQADCSRFETLPYKRVRARPIEDMNDLDTNRQTIPDALIHWTTSGALIAFGVIFFNDASIMGRTILALGILSAANEALKLRAVRTVSKTSYRVRLWLAVAYVSLVLIGFLLPSSGG